MMRLTLLFLTSLSASFLCHADVPWGYESVAQKYDVPAVILYSVALQESEVPGIGRPWPWTANVGGRGYYFDNREELYTFLCSVLEQGKTSFDIGLGQINWYWNGVRFNSLWEATDPYINLHTAAAILREHYLDTHSWSQAVGRYHSPGNAARAASYIASVGRKLERVLGQ
jgi:hypothetical protein